MFRGATTERVMPAFCFQRRAGQLWLLARVALLIPRTGSGWRSSGQGTDNRRPRVIHTAIVEGGPGEPGLFLPSFKYPQEPEGANRPAWP